MSEPKTRGGYHELARLEAKLDYLALEAQEAQKALADGRMKPAEVTLRMRLFARAVHELADEGGRQMRLLQNKPEPKGAARRRALFSVNEKAASVVALTALESAA